MSIVAVPFIDEGLQKRHFREDGVEVWPCEKCGKDHIGPYAIYDWGHCNCPHEKYYFTFLWGPDDAEFPAEWDVMCAGCGLVMGYEDYLIWKPAGHVLKTEKRSLKK